MVKLSAPDVPPPGLGENTVIDAVPAAAMSLAGIAACSWVPLTKVLGRGAPFHCTTDDARKSLPLAVRVNPAPPAVALLGESELSVGAGFGGALMVKLSAPDVPPPGLGENTVTDAVPAAAMSSARIAACSWVPTKVVVRALPFHCTTDDARKSLPLAV